MRPQWRCFVTASLLCFSAHGVGDPVEQPLLLGYISERCEDVLLGEVSAVTPPGFTISPQAVAGGLRNRVQCGAAFPVYVMSHSYLVFSPGGAPRYDGELKSFVFHGLLLSVNGVTGTSIGIRH